jgi:HEPN domain-containing protein
MVRHGLPAHAIFTLHLALEKLLKGYYMKLRGKVPPKTHSLLYFIGELSLQLPQDEQSLLEELEGMGIEARYPPSLDDTLQWLTPEKVVNTLTRSQLVFTWIKQEFLK